MNINFTTTAMARPEIVERTYQSFSQNIKGISLKECDLYINIDPIEGRDSREVISIGERYFNRVVSNVPKKPNFTKAVNWCWSSANSDFILHLEDDWVLTSPIDIKQLINKKMKGKVKQIMLRAYKYKYEKMALSPSIIKRDLYKSFVDKFDFNLNPEIQLRKEWVSPSNISVSGKGIVVKDIEGNG